MKLLTTSSWLTQPHPAHPTKRAFHYNFEEFNNYAYICLILAKSLGHFFMLNLFYNQAILIDWIIDLRDEFFEKVYKCNLMLYICRYAPYNGLN